jgi:membrane protease YdiL (CAAX protease family)
MPTTLYTIFMDRNRRVRAGWAILLYLVTVASAIAGLSTLIQMFDLISALPPITTIDDPRLVVSGLSWLIGGLGATVVGSALVRDRFGQAGFSDPRALPRAALGLALGAGIVAVAVAVPWGAGRLGLGGPTRPGLELVREGALQLGAVAPQSVAEEIVMRGFLLRQLIRGAGRPVAVLATGSIFGVLHLFNPNASWLAALNIALVGIMLGVIVIRTGSLWMTMGMHVAWNFCEGFVFGQPVSGLGDRITVLHKTADVGKLWTGGAFGPEASIPAALVTVLVTVVALAWRTKPQ